MTPKTGPKGKKRPGYVIFSSKSTNEPIFIKIEVVGRNFSSRFLVPALLRDKSYLNNSNRYVPIVYCASSGESAFHSLMSGFAWAKDPMFPRLSGLDTDVPGMVKVILGGIHRLCHHNFGIFYPLRFCYMLPCKFPLAVWHNYICHLALACI